MLLNRNAFRILFTPLLAAAMCIALAGQGAAQQPEEEGVCARVRIKISQEVTITRTAFRATLEISNNPENVALQNLKVNLDIRDSSGQSANDLFGIAPPVLTNISDVNGGGSIGPGVMATAVWTIIPTRDAAPEVDTQYSIGGSFSYVEDGQTITSPLFPATIWVKPDARLILDYFLVRDVYSDDPFTSEIEPSQPFPLGLLLSNQGKGVANNVRITSGQPQIMDNEKGLLIDFKIIGAQVNTDPASPSLTVNLGNIDPGQTTVAKWMMTSSLQGKFISYSATFEHIDGLGDPRLSLIDSVNIHELTHAVRVDIPSDDRKPDFLVNDVQDETVNPDHLPNILYNSAGPTEPVGVASFPTVNGTLSPSALQVSLTAMVQAGWIYIKADDPGGDKYRLARVIRSDGREIAVSDNAWTTHKWVRLKGQTPYREHKLHIFDKDSTGSYTLVYELIAKGATAIGDAKSLADGAEVKLGGSEGLAVTTLLDDCMYVESLDRTCGIKVKGVSAFEGDRVALEGTLQTDSNGERYLAAAKSTSVGSGMLLPLGTNSRSLWSGNYSYDSAKHTGQRGMAGGAGLNTIGLFIRVAGKVTYPNSTSFILDDGSATGGVKIILPSGAKAPAEGIVVMVTGVVSCEVVNSQLYPVIRIGHQEDIFAYNQGPAITDIQVINIRAASADVLWSTDVQASSQVLLGTQPGVYTATIDGPDWVQGHQVPLVNLTPNTTYYFIVRSKNYRNGIITTSAEQSFKTMDNVQPVLNVAFPTAHLNATTVTATAQITNTGGPATNIKITALQASPTSVGVISAAPLTFGTGAVPNGGTLAQDLQFNTTAASFYVKLTITYKDSAGIVRTLTTPWKKVVVQ